MTAKELCLAEALRGKGCTTYFHWEAPAEERGEVTRKAAQADWFIASANGGITRTGKIVNIDGTGTPGSLHDIRAKERCPHNRQKQVRGNHGRVHGQNKSCGLRKRMQGVSACPPPVPSPAGVQTVSPRSAYAA